MEKKSNSKFASILKYAAKIVLIAAMLAWVLNSIDTDKAISYLSRANLWYVVAAFLALFFAQICSAFRIRYYFSLAGEHWTPYFSIVFYFVGMFLNNLLPSSVGGDGYKVYFLKKHHDVSAKLSFRLIVSERANGLFMLLFLATVISLFSQLPKIVPYYYALCAAWLVVLVIGYFVSIRLLLKEHARTAIHAFRYSLGVQGLNFVCFTFCLAAIGQEWGQWQTLADYNVLFLAASFITILPITIGGAGVRELTLLHGAELFGIDIEMGVVAAFLFFLVTTVCATFGAPYLHRLNAIYKQQITKQ